MQLAEEELLGNFFVVLGSVCVCALIVKNNFSCEHAKHSLFQLLKCENWLFYFVKCDISYQQKSINKLINYENRNYYLP